MRVLVIAPHPDDDAIGMGGTIIDRVIAGDTVEVLYLTDGGAGIPGATREEASAVRMAEAEEASRLLGVHHLTFLNIQDQHLGAEAPYFIGSLAERMAEYDVVYTTHEGEEHPDHAAAARLVKAALTQLEAEGRHTPTALGFEVWTPIARPSRMVDISEWIDQKRTAIEAHVSQARGQSFAVAASALNRYRGEMHNRPHGRYAEAFTYLKGHDMTVGIVFTTFAPSVEHERHEYAKRSLQSLLGNIRYSGDRFLVIADDGSGPGHVDALIAIARGLGFEPTVTNSQRGGYGANYNLGTTAARERADFIMPVEDDWQLLQPLDLSLLASALEAAAGRMECIRLGFLGWTAPLRGDLLHVADQTYLVFDPQSPEHHVFAGGPRFETAAFERRVGPWVAGIGAGQAEIEVCGRPAARTGVAWPMDLGVNASQQHANLFVHIGSVSVSQAELAR